MSRMQIKQPLQSKVMSATQCQLSEIESPNTAFVNIFYREGEKCHWFIIPLAFCPSLYRFTVVLNNCCRAKNVLGDNLRAGIKNKHSDGPAPVYWG